MKTGSASLIGAVAAVALIGTIGYQLASTAPDAAPQESVPSHAETSYGIYGRGFVEPAGRVRHLAFARPGVIGEMHVREGQEVERGELLAQLDVRDLNARLAQAQANHDLAEARKAQATSQAHEAELDEAQTRVAISQRRLEQARRDYGRMRHTYEKDVISELEYEHARLQVEIDELEVTRARAVLSQLTNPTREIDEMVLQGQVDVAEREIEHIQAELAMSEIRAPAVGRVLRIHRREGEQVGVQADNAIMEFAASESRHVRVEFDERFVGQVAEGANATITGRGLSGDPVEGRVTEIRDVMGRKRHFSDAPTERIDLDVFEAIVETEEILSLPIHLEVDVEIEGSGPRYAPTEAEEQ